MAKLAVLASGSGSNFEALAVALAPTRHKLVLLCCDKPGAFALERASRLGVPSLVVEYRKGARNEAERAIEAALLGAGADVIALAGFMRLLSPRFVRAFAGRLVNVHPSPLPAYPGVDSVARMIAAGERTFGVTVHLVDEGMDTGPILAQERFDSLPGEFPEAIERRVHRIEHEIFPREALRLLDAADGTARRV